jgi:predicted transcriptional regulator
MNLFFRAPPYILMNIDDGLSTADVAKKSKMTYSHTNKVIHTFNYLNLIYITKKGSRNVITLSNKGKQVQDYFKKIVEVIEDARRAQG